jgi:hypothetical protein
MIEMTIANAGRWRILVNMFLRCPAWIPYREGVALPFSLLNYLVEG